MYNIKYKKQSPDIRFKIVVQTDGIDFGMYSQTFQMIYDTLKVPIKAEN